MSKYTTEVRYICETLSGLSESVGYNDVEQVIKNCLPKVFDFRFPIFDENYRQVLETKILRHYYTREIGLETVGLWKLKLNTKLNEIMPYYNKLYKSELIDFNPLYDVDITRERETKGNGTKDTESSENRANSNNTDRQFNGDESSNSNGTQNQNTNGNGNSMYSDTPQGSITDLQSGKYLTNATFDSANNTFSGASHDDLNRITRNGENVINDNNTESESSSNTTITNTEEYLEHVYGSNGGESFSKRVADYRNTFINIDMMVINELEELFFGLW